MPSLPQSLNTFHILRPDTLYIIDLNIVIIRKLIRNGRNLFKERKFKIHTNAFVKSKNSIYRVLESNDTVMSRRFGFSF